MFLDGDSSYCDPGPVVSKRHRVMSIQDRLTQTHCVTAGELQSLSGAPCVGRLVLCGAGVLQTGLAPVLICSGPGTSRGPVLRSTPPAVQELIAESWLYHNQATSHVLFNLPQHQVSSVCKLEIIIMFILPRCYED